MDVTKVLWVFNPNFITVTGTAGSTQTVTVSSGNITKTISVVLKSTSAKVMVSGLLKAMFDTTALSSTRSKTITINGTSYVAVWGAIGYDDVIPSTRTLQWFTHFPMKVDRISSMGITTTTVTDGMTEAGGATLVYRSETEGVYLRWIDRFGRMEYYLFDKGDKTIKNSLSDTKIEELKSLGGLCYASYKRPMSTEVENTLKVCADNLDAETLDYVSTIIGSPYVEMYLGDNKWLPINVADGSYTYSEHHLTARQDLEITLQLPNKQTQSL